MSESIERRRLAAKVAAVNLAGKVGNELFPRLVKFFTPYVGKVILKDGQTASSQKCLLAKIKEELDKVYQDEPHIRVVFSPDYGLAWTVRASAAVAPEEDDNFPGRTEYHELNVIAGKLDGKTLASVGDVWSAPSFRMDYTVESVLKARKKAEVAEQAYADAKEACKPFGLY